MINIHVDIVLKEMYRNMVFMYNLGSGVIYGYGCSNVSPLKLLYLYEYIKLFNISNIEFFYMLSYNYHSDGWSY